MSTFDCEKQADPDCKSKPVVGEEPEKPSEYRLLHPGETIQPGDQFKTLMGEWLGYRVKHWGFPVSQYATVRRPVVTVGAEQLIVEPQYRELEYGEFIQQGDEFWNVSSGEWNTYSSDFWGCPISRYTTGRRPVAAVKQQQVAAVNTKALVENLQARLDASLRCNAELTARVTQLIEERDAAINVHLITESKLIEERDAALTLRAIAESNCCEFMQKYDAAMRELRETRNDRQNISEELK